VNPKGKKEKRKRSTLYLLWEMEGGDQENQDDLPYHQSRGPAKGLEERKRPCSIFSDRKEKQPASALLSDYDQFATRGTGEKKKKKKESLSKPSAKEKKGKEPPSEL